MTTFTFDDPIDAIGFDYTQMNEAGIVPVLTMAGGQYTLLLNPLPYTTVSPLFWGIIADTATTTMVIDSDFDSAYGIDELTLLPEPAILVLLALGGVALLRRKR